MRKISAFIQEYHKAIGISLLLIGIIFQSHYKFSNPVLATDEMWQLISAKTFWEGHGISIVSPDVNDLSARVYSTQEHWAPGVPIVISPIFFLTSHNVIISEWILVVVGIILLFLSWFFILQLLKPHVDDLIIIAFMLFCAFAYNPIRSLGLSDILSLSAYSVVVLLLMNLLLTLNITARRELLYIVLASIASYLTCFFRYAYYGIAFSLPILLLLYGLTVNRKYLKYSVLSAVIIAALIIPEFRFMVSPQTSQTSVDNKDFIESIDQVHNNKVTSTIKWELIQHLDHIFSNGFFPDWVLKKLFGSDGMREPATLSGVVFLAALSIFMGVLLIVGLTKLMWGIGKTTVLIKNWSSIQKYLTHPVIVFLIIGIVSIAINVGIMTYLELRYTDSYSLPYYGYLNYTRYFPVTIVFIQMMFFVILFFKDFTIGKFYKKILLATIICGFIFNIAHWGYMKTKLSWFDYESNLGMMKIPEGAPADYFILQKAVSANELPIVFMGNNTDVPEVLSTKYENKFMHVFAAVAGASMSNFQTILDSDLKSSEKIEVWIPISTREPEKVLVEFCTKNNATKIMTLERAGFDIMSITVQPNL